MEEEKEDRLPVRRTATPVWTSWCEERTSSAAAEIFLFKEKCCAILSPKKSKGSSGGSLSILDILDIMSGIEMEGIAATGPPTPQEDESMESSVTTEKTEKMESRNLEAVQIISRSHYCLSQMTSTDRYQITRPSQPSTWLLRSSVPSFGRSFFFLFSGKCLLVRK